MVLPPTSPLSRGGSSYSLPLIRGGLEWGKDLRSHLTRSIDRVQNRQNVISSRTNPMPLHSYLCIFTLTATLLLSGQQLSAQTAPLKYVPDPTFSVLSRRGTPKDITYGGGKRSVCLNRANPDRGLTAILPSADFGGSIATTNPTF